MVKVSAKSRPRKPAAGEAKATTNTTGSKKHAAATKKGLCYPDRYYLDILLKSKSLSNASKKLYISRISTWTSEICLVPLKGSKSVLQTCSLSAILSDPTTSSAKLDSYISSKKKSMYTREGYLMAMKAIFLHNSALKNRFHDIYVQWNKVHAESRIPIESKYLSNEPDEKQKKAYIPFEEIIRIRDALEPSAKTHQARLLLFMYTEIPPARADYHHLMILHKDKEYSENEDVGNVLLLESNRVILTQFKTRQKYKTIEIPLPPALQQEIRNSLEIHPRNYLFVGKNGKPYQTTNSFVQWANRVLKSTLDREDISLTTLRHIYISRRDLKLERLSGLEQKKVADQMGHGVAMQKRYNWHAWNSIA